MTITLKDLKQPSKAVYLMALLGLDTSGQKIHWRLCARIINTYRKGAKDGFQIKERPKTEEKERQEKDPLTLFWERVRNRKRRLQRAKVNQVQGSRKNAATSNALKLVFRFKSKGKGRPSRKRSFQFISYPITIHLKGSKYSGGHSVF